MIDSFQADFFQIDSSKTNPFRLFLLQPRSSLFSGSVSTFMPILVAS